MLDTFYPLIAALLANSVAQALKPIFYYLKIRVWDWSQIFASGGFQVHTLHSWLRSLVHWD